jgi:hypothetical protein
VGKNVAVLNEKEFFSAWGKLYSLEKKKIPRCFCPTKPEYIIPPVIPDRLLIGRAGFRFTGSFQAYHSLLST